MSRLSRRALIVSASTSLVASPAIVSGQTARRWRCATSWAKNMPGPGVSARRLAERISALTDGQIVVDVFGAGEVVPALQVFDAVSSGAVDVGHTAALFWGGKMPIAPVFTTLPFGPDPLEHLAWLTAGGQALWDDLYGAFGVKPFVGGNTGPSAAGWFRREITSLDDLKGLRIRATGFGGELYTALGATAMALPPADTYAALERGVVDAVELLAPSNDAPLGFNKLAPFYVFPGFNKPNGASEFIVGAKIWRDLPRNLQAAVEAACAAEHAAALAEAHASNAKALLGLVQSGTRLVRLRPEDLSKAEQRFSSVRDRLAGTGPEAARILAHLGEFLAATRPWSAISRV